jgi:hypothetical protein
MYPDSAFFVILPVGLYLGLVLLPADRGSAASAVALGAATLFLIASVGARGGANDLLDREFQAFFAGTLTSAAAAALAYHRLSRARVSKWPWRAVGLILALGATGLISMILIGIL